MTAGCTYTYNIKISFEIYMQITNNNALYKTFPI